MTTNHARHIKVEDWGRMDYETSMRRQAEIVTRRANDDNEPDRLVIVEHPPTVTIGKTGGAADLCLDRQALEARGVCVVESNRGGMATYHAPGQLVVYPIIKLVERDLHQYVNLLLQTAAEVLRGYGLDPKRDSDQPGLWVGGSKIASMGVAAHKWVVSHGVAINANNEIDGFSLIVPCGRPGQAVTSISKELGRSINLPRLKARFIEQFCATFGFQRHKLTPGGKPEWLKKSYQGCGAIEDMESRLNRLHLATVCQSAHCPNLGECFNRGTATFMIMGERCTRNCRFCAVPHGPKEGLDPDEPRHLAEAAAELNLRHVVVTSVTRDDLPDGGAAHFAAVIAKLREKLPRTSVEVLVPDFQGSSEALETVCQARPDVFNHNVETVPRLYKAVRPQANYRQSLGVLSFAAGWGLTAKSGIMLGLGERDVEIRQVLADLLDAGCTYLTLGQYLAPSAKHAPVEKFVTPEEFDAWGEEARRMGFTEVASGPLVRSSYMADRMHRPGQPLHGDAAHGPQTLHC